jgi:hypothetical protein
MFKRLASSLMSIRLISGTETPHGATISLAFFIALTTAGPDRLRAQAPRALASALRHTFGLLLAVQELHLRAGGEANDIRSSKVGKTTFQTILAVSTSQCNRDQLNRDGT